jgi:hypothetical protein
MKVFLCSADVRGRGRPRYSRPGGRRYMPGKYIFMWSETWCGESKIHSIFAATEPRLARGKQEQKQKQPQVLRLPSLRYGRSGRQLICNMNF